MNFAKRSFGAIMVKDLKTAKAKMELVGMIKRREQLIANVMKKDYFMQTKRDVEVRLHIK